VTSLLSQKKDIKRQQVLIDRMKAEEELQKEEARQRAREKVLKDFEKVQGAGGSGRNTPTTTTITVSSSRKTLTATEGGADERGTKRKFELDVDEVERVSKEFEDAALRQIEKDQVRFMRNVSEVTP
jgi:nitric oxide synthase-interacting protein